MQKQQPTICAGDLSEGEVYEWMKHKTRAFAQLEAALARKELVQRELADVEKTISELTNSAALEWSNTTQGPIHLLVFRRNNH